MLRRGDKYNGREIKRLSYDHEAAKLDDPELSTKQEFKEECDINVIWNKFNRTGDLRLLQKAQPFYADVTETPQDYLSALNLVKQADEAFAILPAAVRNRFKNDPSEILGFVQDAKNRDEAIALGLIPQPAATPKEQRNVDPGLPSTGAQAQGATPPVPKP